jgi:hypothetical protein
MRNILNFHRIAIVTVFALLLLAGTARAVSEVTGTLDSNGGTSTKQDIIKPQPDTQPNTNTGTGTVVSPDTSKSTPIPPPGSDQSLQPGTEGYASPDVTIIGEPDQSQIYQSATEAQQAENQSQLASVLSLLAAGNIVAWLWLLVVVAVLAALVSYIYNRRIEEQYEPE